MGLRDDNQPPVTVIASGVKMEGDFFSEGEVLIEGVVEGSVRTESNLTVGERARINANVTAANAVVAGEVKGNISISERLELQPSSHIYGDVQTKILVVAQGAIINGRIIMEEAGKQERQVKSATKQENLEKLKAKIAVSDEVAPITQEKEKEKRVLNAFFSA